MQKSNAKKGKNKTWLVGAVILLIALAIVLAVVLVPIIRENKEMRHTVDLLLHSEYRYITVSDPLFDTDVILPNKGAEVKLEETEVLAVRELLSAATERGLQNRQNETQTAGAWDLRLLLVTTTGERAALYLTETTCYYTAGNTAYHFAPKNTEAYQALRTHLIALLQAA